MCPAQVRALYNVGTKDKHWPLPRSSWRISIPYLCFHDLIWHMKPHGEVECLLSGYPCDFSRRWGPWVPNLTHLQERKNDKNFINLVDMTPDNPQDPMHTIKSDEELLADDHTQSELLRCHHELSHIPPRNLRVLSMIGIFPNYLATVNPAKCVWYIYRSMTKRPWVTKMKQGLIEIHPVTAPGKFVSVDQPKYLLQGFIS